MTECFPFKFPDCIIDFILNIFYYCAGVFSVISISQFLNILFCRRPIWFGLPLKKKKKHISLRRLNDKRAEYARAQSSDKKINKTCAAADFLERWSIKKKPTGVKSSIGKNTNAGLQVTAVYFTRRTLQKNIGFLCRSRYWS